MVFVRCYSFNDCLHEKTVVQVLPVTQLESVDCLKQKLKHPWVKLEVREFHRYVGLITTIKKNEQFFEMFLYFYNFFN